LDFDLEAGGFTIVVILKVGGLWTLEVSGLTRYESRGDEKRDQDERIARVDDDVDREVRGVLEEED
jgi:hypothetical protein